MPTWLIFPESFMTILLTFFAIFVSIFDWNLWATFLVNRTDNLSYLSRYDHFWPYWALREAGYWAVMSRLLVATTSSLAARATLRAA